LYRRRRHNSDFISDYHRSAANAREALPIATRIGCAGNFRTETLTARKQKPGHLWGAGRSIQTY
jgi:hypothetical protein